MLTAIAIDMVFVIVMFRFQEDRLQVDCRGIIRLKRYGTMSSLELVSHVINYLHPLAATVIEFTASLQDFYSLLDLPWAP